MLLSFGCNTVLYHPPMLISKGFASSILQKERRESFLIAQLWFEPWDKASNIILWSLRISPYKHTPDMPINRDTLSHMGQLHNDWMQRLSHKVTNFAFCLFWGSVRLIL